MRRLLVGKRLAGKELGGIAAVMLLWSLIAVGVSAETDGTAKAVSAETANRILKNLRAGRGDLEYTGVLATPVPGIYEVSVVRGPTLFVSEDGKHFFAGDLYRIDAGQFVNLQEQSREKKRAELMASVDKSEQIIFSPKGETKAYVNVFTDVDCGYCQKLHSEIAQINARGIEVRYLAYPRAGVNSESARKLATAWCAEDKQLTLTKCKNRESLPIKVCENNPVARHYQLGGLIGVTGTPNMVTATGELIGGYLAAEDLAKFLGIEE